TFGEEMIHRDGLGFEYQPAERLTDFNTLEEAWQTGNFQACFLFSDGVATSGKDPGAVRGPAGVPIFTVGVGDTSAGLDLSITDVKYPLSMLAQEQSEIEIQIHGVNAQGRRGKLYVFHEDQLISSDQLIFSSNDHYQTFKTSVVARLDAPNFRAELTVLPEEANIGNNSYRFQIDVLPGKRQVTLLTGRLSPNSGLINRTVSEINNISFSRITGIGENWQGDLDAFWRTPQDLVLLDNYPAGAAMEDHLKQLLRKIRSDKSAVLVIEGANSGQAVFQTMMKALGLEVEKTYQTDRLTRVRKGKSAVFNEIDLQIYDSFNDQDLPPTRQPNRVTSRTSRRLSAIFRDETQRALAAYGTVEGRPRAMLLLPDLAAYNVLLQRTAASRLVGEVLKSLVEWSLKPKDFNPYVMQPQRSTYHLGERVSIRGSQRDRSGAKLIQPSISLEIRGPGRAELITLNYNFETGEYEGEYWPGEAGAHYFKIIEGDAESRTVEKFAFTVQAGRVELESLTQNLYGLQRLAEVSGGQYTEPHELGDVLDQQAYVVRTVIKERNFNIWQFRSWWLIIIILGLEWILRRSIGLI
ncbi:MAG: hypothetical protein KAU50_05630, partial [Candidatus Marinimicrobia bacterium]|nr:hypothetical protein [Candidatus Neomarinimicrobiota bacterium]